LHANLLGPAKRPGSSPHRRRIDAARPPCRGAHRLARQRACAAPASPGRVPGPGACNRARRPPAQRRAAPDQAVSTAAQRPPPPLARSMRRLSAKRCYPRRTMPSGAGEHESGRGRPAAGGLFARRCFHTHHGPPRNGRVGAARPGHPSERQARAARGQRRALPARLCPAHGWRSRRSGRAAAPALRLRRPSVQPVRSGPGSAAAEQLFLALAAEADCDDAEQG
jgi:hypothetical protein